MSEDGMSDLSRAEFMVEVTHELKTPLHSILGMGEALTEGIYGPLNKDQIRALELTRHASEQLLRMVDDFVQFERAEAGLLDLHVEDVDLQNIVQAEIASLEWMGERKRLETEVEISANRVRANERLVRQVIRNLVAHSLKFAPWDSTVRVSVDRVDDTLSIVVEDEGPTVAEGEREDLFDAFWRVKRSVRAYGGSGFSLGVVRRLARAMGGTASVTDAADRGARFEVRIPVESHP